jgi:hypothetical protein
MQGRSLDLWRRWRAKFGAARGRTKRPQSSPGRSAIAGRAELLERRELLTVTYQGGAVLPNVEAQAVYLGSAWNTNSSLHSQAQSTDQFLSALANGPYMDMLNNAGYGVGRGTASAGAVDNVNLSANATLTDSQIQSDLKTMISQGQVQAPDANRLYMVYVEPGVVVQLGSANSTTSFLGYHGAFNDNGTDIHYAVMTAPGSPNPSAAAQGFASNFDELTSVSSHELAEAVTDPNVNYKALGWYDNQLNGEIADLADLAEGHESTISGSNGAQYVVQDVVNQNDQVIGPSTGQTPTPTPTPTPAPSSSLSSPTLQGSAVSTTVAQLKWNGVNGAEGYNIYLVVNGQGVLLGTVSASTTAVQVTGLTPGATESFAVEAFNSTSVADSSVVSVTMPAPVVQTVTAPHLTAHAASPTSIVLSWGSEPQADGYNIYWWNGYRAVFLGTVGSSTTSITINGLRPGSGSYFLVEAFNNVSYADSQWIYAATPFYSIGADGASGQYAGQQTSDSGSGAHATSSSASEATGSHWSRGRF